MEKGLSSLMRAWGPKISPIPRLRLISPITRLGGSVGGASRSRRGRTSGASAASRAGQTTPIDTPRISGDTQGAPAPSLITLLSLANWLRQRQAAKQKDRPCHVQHGSDTSPPPQV